MINFVDIPKENLKELNPDWPYIPDQEKQLYCLN